MAIKKRPVKRVVTPAKPVKETVAVEEVVEEVVMEEEEVVETVSKPSREEAEAALETTVEEIKNEESDFVKIDSFGAIMKDLLATEGYVTSNTAGTRMFSKLGNIMLDLMENGNRFSIGSKQTRVGNNRARIFKAREGFSNLDTLQFPHKTIGVTVPVMKQENIKGTYVEETDTFTAEDGSTYIVNDLNED